MILLLFLNNRGFLLFLLERGRNIIAFDVVAEKGSVSVFERDNVDDDQENTDERVEEESTSLELIRVEIETKHTEQCC